MDDITTTSEKISKPLDTEIVHAVARGALQENDKLLYEHPQYGTIKAIVKERDASTIPVCLILQSNHPRLLGTTIRVPILSPSLRPKSTEVSVSLKDLLQKKAQMMQKFAIWDGFWIQTLPKNNNNINNNDNNHNFHKNNTINHKNNNLNENENNDSNIAFSLKPYPSRKINYKNNQRPATAIYQVFYFFVFVFAFFFIRCICVFVNICFEKKTV